MCSYVQSCCGSVGSMMGSAGQAIGNALSCVIEAVKRAVSSVFAGGATAVGAFMGLTMPVQLAVGAGVVLAIGAAAYACGCFSKKSADQKQDPVDQKPVDQKQVESEGEDEKVS